MSALGEILGRQEQANKESTAVGGGAVVPPTTTSTATSTNKSATTSSTRGTTPVKGTTTTTESTERVRTITPTSAPAKPLTETTTKIKRYIPSGGGAVAPSDGQAGTAIAPAGTTKSSVSSGTEVRKPHDQGAVGVKGERFLDVLKRYGATPPTPEQVEEERKRQRNRERIAAIGDAISSIANLYHTTNYAPSAYDPKSSALGSVRAQGDRAKAAQDRDRDAYLQHYMRALQLDNARDDHERSWQHKLEQDRLAHQRAKEEAARKQKWDEEQIIIKQKDQEREGKKLEEDIRKHKAQERLQADDNATARGRLNLDRKRYKDSQSKSENVYLGEYIGYKEINTDGVPYAYSALPDEYKSMFGEYDPKTRTYKAPSKARMLDAIRYAADKDPELAQRILNIGGNEGTQVTGMKPVPRRFNQSGGGGGQPQKTPTPQRRTNMPYLGKQSQAGQAKGKDSRKQDNNIAPWKRK